MAWLTGYAHRKEITVQDTNVDGALTNFPALVMLSNDSDYTDALATGYDIRFTQSDGDTTLYYERQSWSGGGGSNVTATFWVNVPSIASSGGATIYIYWQKAGDSDGEDADNTWPAACKAVWHLEEASGTLTDSSGNSHDSDAEDIGTYQATGKINYGMDFVPASNHYARIPHHADWAFADEFTLEAWAEPDNTAADLRIMYHYDGGSTDGFYLSTASISGGRWRFTTFVGAVSADCHSDGAPSGAFQHVAGTRDNSGGMTIYVNGVAQADTETNAGAIDSSDPVYIGRSSSGANDWDGILDEIRIWGEERSAAELKFTYYNANEADHELTWGSKENVPTGVTFVPRVIFIG